MVILQVTKYLILCIQAFLVLEYFCDFYTDGGFTDGGFTDTRFACDPPAVLGVRMSVCPQPNLM